MINNETIMYVLLYVGMGFMLVSGGFAVASCSNSDNSMGHQIMAMLLITIAFMFVLGAKMVSIFM